MTHTQNRPEPRDPDAPRRVNTPATARIHLRITEQRELRTAKATVAQRIDTAIRANGWTQTQAAAALDASPYTIRRIMRLHTNTLSLDLLLTVAARLSLDYTLTVTHPTDTTLEGTR